MDIPEGPDFLQLVWDREDNIEKETDAAIPSLGSKTPACWNEVGTVLSYLDRMASCWWGCNGGDHMIEYLCGRVQTNGRASMRLLRFGFYDETLALCRSMGEIANLMHLFAMDSNSLQEWKTATSEGKKTFIPVVVRRRLEQKAKPLAADQERYSMLSGLSIHVNSATRPQCHNVLGVPSADVYLQKPGLVMCLNEIARPLAIATVFGTKLLNIDGNTKEQIRKAVTALTDQIGALDITTIEEYRQNIRDTFDDWDEVQAAMSALQRDNPSVFRQVAASFDA